MHPPACRSPSHTVCQVADERGSQGNAALLRQRVDMGGWNEPEPAHRDNQQADDNPALIAKLGGQHTGRHRHEKVPQIVRKLHPRRLRLVQVEHLLEVLVHDVDHAVAHGPDEEQRADKNEREHEVVPVLAHEKAWLLCVHERTILTHCPLRREPATG